MILCIAIDLRISIDLLQIYISFRIICKRCGLCAKINIYLITCFAIRFYLFIQTMEFECSISFIFFEIGSDSVFLYDICKHRAVKVCCMLQIISRIQTSLISSEHSVSVRHSIELIQIQRFQIISDTVINSPVYIKCIESLGKYREIITTTPNRTHFRHSSIVGIQRHKSCYISLHRDFKDQIRFLHTILWHCRHYIIHHNGYRSFSDRRI